MDLKRDLFISEEIISYLQSTYQNIYSDTNIIKNYVRYKELLLKKETAKTHINSPEFSIIFTEEDEIELETLNRYFYGNSDGSNSGDGNNLAYTYLSTIDTIKELINKSDNSIKDVVMNLTALLDNPSMSDEAYKRYLNELIIPGILGTSEITAEKIDNKITTGNTVSNEYSDVNKKALSTKLLAEQTERQQIDDKIKLAKEESKQKIIDKQAETRRKEKELRDQKISDKDQLIAKNKEALTAENTEILKTKLETIKEDVNLKIETIDNIIKNDIFKESIIKYFSKKENDDDEDNEEDDSKEEEDVIKDKNKDKDKKLALYAGSDEKKRKDIGLLQVKLNKQEALVIDYIFQLKIEISFPYFMKNLYEFLLVVDRKKPLTEDKKQDLLKKIEECNKQIEEIRNIRSNSSYITNFSNEKIKTLLFYISFDMLYINKIKEKIAELKKELKKKKGGGSKKSSLIIRNIYESLIKTKDLSVNKIDSEIIKKTDKLLLLYIRLYDLYIKPINKKLREFNESKESNKINKDKTNLPKDLLLLYENFKKEYDEFIRENKEIKQPEEAIKKNKDTLVKKNSQKKTDENPIKQSILDLFEQYENLAIKLKDSEKIIIKKSMKGGASKKLYLEDIKKALDDYLKNITDTDKQSKIDSLKSKIETMQKKYLDRNVYQTLIQSLNSLVIDANNIFMQRLQVPVEAAQKAKSLINDLFVAIPKINIIKEKLESESKSEKNNIQDLFIQLNIELTNAYNQIKILFSILSLTVKPDINIINENIEKLSTDYNDLKEINDKFNEIKKLLDSDTQDISKKFEEINDLFKKLKTLKYLNKYKYYLDEIKNLLDEIKNLLDKLAKNDDNDDGNDNDDMKKELQEEITELQEKLDKTKGKNAENKSKLNDTNADLKKVRENINSNEISIAGYEAAVSAQIGQKVNENNKRLEEEKKKLVINNQKSSELNIKKGEFENQIKLNEDLIENIEKQIKSIKKRLEGIDSSKEKANKEKKIAANLESQREFIRDISNQLKEYLILVDYLNKIIKSIGLIKKTLNELILSKLNSQMKEKFKFIQKRYIKALIDFYNFKIISDYIIKLNNIEKLKPQEKQDEKLTDNIESRYDKIREEYKVAFYKELEDIIRITDYQKIAEIVIKFFNKLIEFLNKDDDIIEDRIDDYQIYLIINLIIKLADTQNKDKIEELFKIYYSLIGDKKDYENDIYSKIKRINFKKQNTGGGYSDIITQDITKNDKLLPIAVINDEVKNLLTKYIYESFIQIRPTKDDITKKKLNTLIPECDIEKYFLTSIPSSYADLQSKVYIDLQDPNNLNINTKEISKFIDTYKIIVRPIGFNTTFIDKLKDYFKTNISKLTLEYIVNNELIEYKNRYLAIYILYYIIIKFINDEQIKINDSLKKDLVYLLYIIIFYYHNMFAVVTYSGQIFIIDYESYNKYKENYKNINELLITLSKNFKSTSDIYTILQYLIKISNYMVQDIHELIDIFIITKLESKNFNEIEDISINVFLSSARSDFNTLSYYFETFIYDNITIQNNDIKIYINKMNNYVKQSKISLSIHFDDTNTIAFSRIISDINDTTSTIMLSLEKYTAKFIKEDIRYVTVFLMNVYVIINNDRSILTSLRKDLLYIIYFLILFQQIYTPNIRKEEYIKYYVKYYKLILDETTILLDKLKSEFTKYSYMNKIFEKIIDILPIIYEDFITNVESLGIDHLNKLLTSETDTQVGVTAGGGNKVIKDNIIDIKKTYDLYYSTNTDDLIIELLEILKTSENVIYLLLIINTSLLQFFKDLNEMLINFYENDILLSYYYDENEIIYYIFLNYIYENYKSLLTLSKHDIIINIGKIKTRENYGNIYKKIDKIFKNPEIIEKLILFIKNHLKIPKSIQHPKKTKDTEYLLLFIYKYSKKEEKTIKGYDAFLTFIYLNILNKFSNKITDLPTLNLYNFSNLKKPYYNFELSSYQNQLSIKLMKDIKLLIAIISNRYRYIEHKTKINPKFIFTINDEIFDYLNIFGNDELFRDYKTMPIMDLHTLNKNLIIDDIIELKETNKNDNIIFNILLLSSYIFKDDNKIPVEIYCKLVKQYFLIKNSKLLNDLTYGMIFLMNKRINKSDIQRKLIKELSSFNIDLSDITIFINPENKEINILELLEKINFSNYIKNDIKIIIPFLYHFYEGDNKFQYTIQDLLCKQLLNTAPHKLIMFGGTSSDEINSETTKTDPIVYKKAIDLINEIFSNKTINEIENQIKKIDKEFGEIPTLETLENDFNKAITMEIKIDAKPYNFTLYHHYISTNTSLFDDLSRDLIKYCTDKDKESTPHSPESMKYKAILNSRLIDIEKFKAKLENVHKNKFINKKTEILKLYEPFVDLIEKIKLQPEIQDYPYIKEIYKVFIKPDDKILDEKEKDIKYEIDKYFNDYEKNVLDKYVSMINDIIEQKQGKLPNLIKNLDDIIINNKPQKNKGGANNTNFINNNTKIFKGGEPNKSLDDYKKLDDKFRERLETKNKKLDTIFKNLKRLKGNREIDNNVEKKLATTNFFDKDGNNIFERLISVYDKDINDKNMPIEITNSLFYDKVKNHNLDPEEELEINLNDKLIFIGLVYCIRVGSLLGCYYLINNNLITDINMSLFYYLIFYYAIFVLILLLINIDTFKMRILVNYMNLHVSTTNIWMHLILMGSFIYLIYLLIVNILGDEKPPTELGEHEKIKLKYKLDLLTILIYTFIIILIFII
jgi:hypothetical protein